jgi:hypothetical protein
MWTACTSHSLFIYSPLTPHRLEATLGGMSRPRKKLSTRKVRFPWQSIGDARAWFRSVQNQEATPNFIVAVALANNLHKDHAQGACLSMVYAAGERFQADDATELAEATCLFATHAIELALNQGGTAGLSRLMATWAASAPRSPRETLQ